jgi:HEAT repeat protein
MTGPRGRPLEDVLAALRRVRESPQAPESVEALRAALRGPSSHAAARAARLVAELGVRGLEAELQAAFARFIERPEKDPGCTAKAAVVDALTRLEHDDPAVFLQGIRHVQMEPVFGGRVDTAVALRGACGLGLAAMGYHDALLELADLLADPQAGARVAAARAIGHRGGEDGVPLLRLRAGMGEVDPEVLAECFSSLLSLDPRSSLPFVSRFLEGGEGLAAEAAALALGASRRPEAFPLLRDGVPKARDLTLRQTLFLALATLRREEAFELLLSIVRDGAAEDAAAAVSALAVQRGDERLRERVVEAAADRTEPRLRQALARLNADG